MYMLDIQFKYLLNSPNWGGGTWESYVNEANISFTVITESVNAGNDIQGYYVMTIQQ